MTVLLVSTLCRALLAHPYMMDPFMLILLFATAAVSPVTIAMLVKSQILTKLFPKPLLVTEFVLSPGGLASFGGHPFISIRIGEATERGSLRPVEGARVARFSNAHRSHWIRSGGRGRKRGALAQSGPWQVPCPSKEHAHCREARAGSEV